MSTFPQFQNTVNHSSISKYCQLLNSLLVWSDLKFIGDGESTFPFNIASGIFIHLRFHRIVFYHLQITTFVKAGLDNEDKWPNMQSSCLHYNQTKSILKISTNYSLFVSKMGISLHELLSGKIKPGTWPFKYFPNPISEVTATPEGEMTPHITPTPQTFWTFQFHFRKSKITWAAQGPEKVEKLTRSGEPRRQWQ